jgi:hypothetical protein
MWRYMPRTTKRAVSSARLTQFQNEKKYRSNRIRKVIWWKRGIIIRLMSVLNPTPLVIKQLRKRVDREGGQVFLRTHAVSIVKAHLFDFVPKVDEDHKQNDDLKPKPNVVAGGGVHLHPEGEEADGARDEAGGQEADGCGYQ